MFIIIILRYGLEITSELDHILPVRIFVVYYCKSHGWIEI